MTILRARNAVPLVLATLLATLLAGCASPGGTLQRAGGVEVFDMRMDTELAWARIKGPFQQEIWTIDGTALNSLSIFAGIKPGEHVFKMSRERTSRPDGPWYRSGMRPEEVRDIVVSALQGQGMLAVATDNLRPQRFGSFDGLRFDFTMTSADGLLYKGTAAAFEEADRKLTLLLWKAPAEYYYGRDVAAVNRMLDHIALTH